MDCFTRRREAKEAYIELENAERGEGENDGFLQKPEPEIEIEIDIEDWVGIHSLKNMPKSFRSQEPSTMDFSQVIQSIKTEHEETKDGSSGRNGNRMTTLFCPPGAAETQVLKSLFKKLKKDGNKAHPVSLYNIILVDAKNPDNIQQSFKKVDKILDRKVDKKNLSTAEIKDKIYKKMDSQSSSKDRNLFVFVGAKSLSEIKPFLPQENLVLPFSQFLVTTNSKTFNWESEAQELDSEKWANKKFLLCDQELIGFDWEGVHSASKLPPSFQPVSDFAGRAEIMNNLVQRFQNSLPAPAPVSKTKETFCQRNCCVSWRRRKDFLFPPPKLVPASSPSLPRATLTVISGVRGIGKSELVKKFLSTHNQIFAKIVLVNAENLWLPLKIIAHNSGIYSETAIEGDSESDKVSFLHSEITKNLQGNQRVLFVFDNADSLEKIKNYLPKNVSCDVIVTSLSRDWEKEDDVKCYRDHHIDFQELPLFDGLSLEETHEFYSKLLSKHNMFYVKKDLEGSIQEFYKYTRGFPPLLQNLYNFISKSSRTNPDLTSKQHMLNYLSRNFQELRQEINYRIKPPRLQNLRKFISELSRSNPEWGPKQYMLNYLLRALQDFRNLITSFDWNQRFADDVKSDSKSSVSKPSETELRLLQTLCLMNPEHLDFHMICYFYFEHEEPFKPPPQKYDPEQVERVKDMLRNFEMDSLIQVDRTEDGQMKKIRVPEFLRESMNAEDTDASTGLARFFYGLNLPHSSWTRPLDVPQLWPHILSLNESYTRFHGYHNQVLVECIQNHLEFWRNPPKDGEIAGEQQQRPDLDYKTEKEKIRNLVNENPEFKKTFGDFTQVENPAFLVPILLLILFLVDVGTDLNNAIIMLKINEYFLFGLSLFLFIVPFTVSCLLHYFDRVEYNRKMKNRRGMSWWEVLRMLAGTLDSYFLRLWYIWKFRRETENLERGLLYERLCVSRANAEYHGIAEAFLESLPQLLFQFSFYLFSYIPYSEKANLDAIRGKWIPFELGLVVSLFSLGLALTKLESVYFGWNMELFGIKRLGHHILHLFINFSHIATLMFCSGIVCIASPFFSLFTPLFFYLTASDWIYFNDKYFVSGTLLSLRTEKSLKSCLKSGDNMNASFASFHPGFLDKGRKLESSSKREFVSAKLGHDILLLQRRPRKSDVIYLFFLLGSICSFAFYCTIFNPKPYFTRIHYSLVLLLFFPFDGSENQYTLCYGIGWLRFILLLQLLRQLLNYVYLKSFKVPPLTEDYILNDPEGILRYPVDSSRWIQLRLYHQIRQNPPSAFSQTWTQVKQTLVKFNKKNVFTIVKFLILLSLKLMYFLVLIFVTAVSFMGEHKTWESFKSAVVKSFQLKP